MTYGDEPTEDDDSIVIAASTENLSEAIAASKGKSVTVGDKTIKVSKATQAIHDALEEPDMEWVEPVRNHESILDSEGNNSLISAALTLMNSSGASADSVKAKKVSLDLVQIGVAELQAYRIARQATTAIILEERMYAPENLKELKKPSQIRDALKELNSNMKDALHYIQGTMSRVKFDTIESYLQDIVDGSTPEDGPGKNQFTKDARAVLDLIAGGEDFDEILQKMGEDGPEEIVIEQTPLIEEKTEEV